MTPDPETLRSLRATAAASIPAYLEELERLVAIPSGTDDPAGIERVAVAMADLLTGVGLEAELRRDGDPAVTGPTLVGRGRGVRPGGRIVVLGHLDTIAPREADAPRLSIREGRAHGTGSADMKGGLLLLIHALRALRDVVGAAVPSGDLVVIGSPDEEIGSPVGAIAIRAILPGASAALVLEPARANGALVAARKGMLQGRIHVRGRAAHAGVEPERGRSAILAAAHLAIALHALGENEGGIPGVTCTVGTFTGGTRPNVVPDSATLGIDLRAPTAAAFARAEEALQRSIRTPAVPDVTMHFEPAGRFAPMERSAATDDLLATVRQVAGPLGLPIDAVATGGASDANLAAELGVPVLDGLGPPGSGMHAADESFDLASLPDRIALLAGTLLALGARRGLAPG